MFSPHEEATLKRIVAENTPMSRPVMKYSEPRQPDTGDYLQRELARCEKIQTVNPNEDWQVINLVKHTMKKGELLSQWYARVLLGRSQILAMTKDQITRFVALAEANNDADGVRPPKIFAESQLRPAPRVVPSAILI